MKPVRLFNSLLVAALTLVGWAAFQVMVEDVRQADPRNSMDWRNMTVFGKTPEVPESHDKVANAKRWMAANADWLQWIIVGVGMFACIHEFRSGLGLKPGQWIWEAPRNRSGWDLDAPLFQWSKSDAWTLRDSFAGTFITGANGSGKTSGSGRAIALAFLRRAKFGGLVLTAKSEETDLWRGYCREAGREQDLVVFGADGALRFDPIDFELNRPGVGAGHTENIVQLLSTLLELTERNTGQGGGREDEGYWRKASRQKTRNIVDLLALSKGKLSIPDMYQVVISAPNSPSEARSAEWRKNSFCFQCLAEADQKQLSPSRKRDLQSSPTTGWANSPALAKRRAPSSFRPSRR